MAVMNRCDSTMIRAEVIADRQAMQRRGLAQQDESLRPAGQRADHVELITAETFQGSTRTSQVWGNSRPSTRVIDVQGKELERIT